jgi:transcriptional regulator with XRE-family HTH domain
MDIKLKIALRIKELREKRGITQEALAYKSDVDRTYMNHVESAKLDISVTIMKEKENIQSNSVPKSDIIKPFYREDFMAFFRDDEKLNELTVDDRVEVFRTILIGNSDFTKELLNEILSDYNVWNLKIVETNSIKD